MKITVIGGGSTYTPELVNGFLQLMQSLPLDELCLMDVDEQRLKVVGGFAQRMVQAKGNPFQVTLSTNQREAIRDAAYVITQLRVGQMAARIADEYLGRRHGLVGQETTGIGGMAKALRTIPVILSIARDVQETAPGALLVNFTNPSGLVTEALTRHAPQVNAVGLCNSAITTKMHILEGIKTLTGQEINPQDAFLDALGLNHLTWYRDFRVNGQSQWAQVFAAFLEEIKKADEPEWDADLLASLRMIPNSYLQYFYHTAGKLALQQQWPPSRGEAVLAIEQDLLHQYADPALTTPPPDLMKRGGAWYSTLATQVIHSHYANLGQVHIINTRQGGAINRYPTDWVMELPATIDRNGVHPLPAEPLPDVCFGLLTQVKMYELLTVEAAIHGDHNAAFQALLAHPLGPDAGKISEVLADMLKTHAAWLPQFGADWQ